PADVVAVCPDQLGPATLRSLPDDLPAFGLPSLDRPSRIDWRDYAERNEAAEPADAVASVLERAGDGAVWMVLTPGYRTYDGYCEAVLGGLGAARPGVLVVEPRSEVFEPMTLYRFGASADGP